MNAAFAPLRAAARSDRAFRPIFGSAPEPAAPDVTSERPAEPGIDLGAIREDARAAGYAAGLEAGQRAAESLEHERVMVALDALTLALEAAQGSAESAAQDAARDLATLTVVLLESLLPGLMARFAPDLLDGLVRSLLPQLRLLRRPRVLVGPGLSDALAPVLQGIELDLAEDAALPPGDLRLEWQAGLLRFDRAARLAALRETLAACGIGTES